MLLSRHEVEYVRDVLNDSGRRKRDSYIEGARYGVWTYRIRKVSAASDEHLVTPSNEQEDRTQTFDRDKQTVKAWMNVEIS